MNAELFARLLESMEHFAEQATETTAGVEDIQGTGDI